MQVRLTWYDDMMDVGYLALIEHNRHTWATWVVLVGRVDRLAPVIVRQH